jgi:hypothetical protein
VGRGLLSSELVLESLETTDDVLDALVDLVVEVADHPQLLRDLLLVVGGGQGRGLQMDRVLAGRRFGGEREGRLGCGVAVCG